MIIKELITYLSLPWKMVVLCLKFRAGTQILIYFPVLLQISSVTLGQLLWEKHAKAPKWLTSPSPFSKMGIVADSQRDKLVGTLTIAGAIPKTIVLPHHFQILSISRPPCPRGDGCLLKTNGKWVGDGMGGMNCHLTCCGYWQAWEQGNSSSS